MSPATPSGVLSMQVASALSIVATLMVMTTIARLKLFNKIFLKMVFFISLSDFFASCATVIGATKSGSAECFIQGAVSNFFELSSFFWSAMICYEVWVVVMHSKIQKNFLLFHAICWGFPALFSFLPLVSVKYDNDDLTPGWCFLTHRQHANRETKETELFWFLFAFYAWLWLVLLYMLYTLLVVSYKLFIEQQGQNDAAVTVVKRMACYPLIIILSWSVPSVLDMLSFQSSSDDDFKTVEDSYIAILCAYVLPNIQGLLTAIAFALVNRDLVTEIVRISFNSSGSKSMNNMRTDTLSTSTDKGYQISLLWSSTDHGSSSGQHERLINEEDIESINSNMVKVTTTVDGSNDNTDDDDDINFQKRSSFLATRPFQPSISVSSSQDDCESSSSYHTYVSSNSNPQMKKPIQSGRRNNKSSSSNNNNKNSNSNSNYYNSNNNNSNNGDDDRNNDNDSYNNNNSINSSNINNTKYKNISDPDHHVSSIDTASYSRSKSSKVSTINSTDQRLYRGYMISSSEGIDADQTEFQSNSIYNSNNSFLNHES